jgi:predicted phosphodiesterase
MARIGVIGDVHEPASHPGYLDFCADTFEQWGCDRFVFIGDVVDFHTISFHSRDIDAQGVNEEIDAAQDGIDRWQARFPKASVMVGNHDERVYRLAASVSIPARFIRDYADHWNTPGWSWDNAKIIDDVLYTHGTGATGKTPALNWAQAAMVSTVLGHVHSRGGICWAAGPTSRLFGMDTGCGVDLEHPAMKYGKALKTKAVLSCGVVIDGHPYHEIMPCGVGEKYHRSRFAKRKKGK